MLSPTHAPGLHRERSRPALRADKKRRPLARWSRLCGPGLAAEASLLCDVLPQPAGKTAEDGNLTN